MTRIKGVSSAVAGPQRTGHKSVKTRSDERNFRGTAFEILAAKILAAKIYHFPVAFAR
jgi:hypothetical protein